MVSSARNYVVLRMNLKVKGLLRGLRYISHVFGEEEKAEMRIGSPKDVRHVAHIRSINGDSAKKPSWMKEFKQANGGIESDTLQGIAYDIEEATAYNIKGIGTSTEESVGCSSREVIIKPKLSKDSKPPGTRRRKGDKPTHKKDASGTRTPIDQEANSSANKPKKTRKRKKKVKKVVVVDNGSERSATNSVSSKPHSVPSTDDSCTLRDQLKSGPIYMSARELSDCEGSYRTVASCWDHRDDHVVEENGEKGDLI